MGAPEIEAFLSMLATERKASASTRNQALSALLFLYREVLEFALTGQYQSAKQPETDSVGVNQGLGRWRACGQGIARCAPWLSTVPGLRCNPSCYGRQNAVYFLRTPYSISFSSTLSTTGSLFSRCSGFSRKLSASALSRPSTLARRL